MKRRIFFSSLGAAGIGLLSLQNWPGMKSDQSATAPSFPPDPLKYSPEDEIFWSIIRKQFPLTGDRAYFNTGGLGVSPYAVLDAVRTKTTELESIGEVGRTETVWRAVKEKVSSHINCTPEELALTGCCTEGMNIAANGIALKRGDEVLLSTHEHVGGALPWLGRQKRDGIVVKTFEPAVERTETLNRIADAMSRRTRVISLSHITCTTGAVLPISDICTFARDKNVRTVVDGAQAAGLIPVDVRNLGCDCYASSGHKWLLGPKRTGLLYIREEILEEVVPYFIGAYSDSRWDFQDGLVYHPTAQRYEYGTYNVSLMIGLETAVSFLQLIGQDVIARRSHNLVRGVIAALREIPAVEILTPATHGDHAGILTLRLKNLDTTRLQKYLMDEYRLRTRFVAEAGLQALRISVHVYNSSDEVERFIDGIRSAAQL